MKLSMNTYHRQLLLCSAVLGLTAATFAETNAPLNRVSVAARLGFNVSGKFSGLGRGLFTAATPVPRLTPDGDQYNYDDGYVLTDVSGNYGGETWYVGYDNSTAQISGNQLLLSRSTASADVSGKDQDADLSVGFEINYQRQIRANDRYAWGVEASVNYQPVQFSDHGTYAAVATKVTDAYTFSAGTTPPTATGSAPYQGSYGGPGFLFGDAITGTTTQVVPSGATFSGRHEFDGNLWGLHLGLYGERQLSQRWHASLSGGLAVGLLSADVAWSESATLPGGGTAALSGGGSDSDVLFGFYFGAGAAYDLGKNWSAIGGVQYQFLGDYSHDFGGRTATVDFGGALYVTIGISKSF